MNIYVLNTLDIGIDTINILEKHLRIRGVIGLSEKERTGCISGYRYMNPYCEQKAIPFIEVESYSLSNPRDRERLIPLTIDILIVAGWQRLIPGWLINRCTYAAIGSHGSAVGITGGRGRSPQNWALILGKKEFHISIFRINEGIDSGEIIDTRSYILSEMDDIKTSYYKASWLTAHMIIETINNGTITSGGFKEQDGEAKYFPQRLPEDGEIDWSRTADQIYDYVRALTHPYPGAFSIVGEHKVTIWKARPFEVQAWSKTWNQGEIVKVFANHDFLVKTGDAFLLVEDYAVSCDDGVFCIEEGVVLPSCNYRKQMKTIVDRHYQKYSTLTLSDEILSVCQRNV